jgi:hypothetical protein
MTRKTKIKEEKRLQPRKESDSDSDLSDEEYEFSEDVLVAGYEVEYLETTGEWKFSSLDLRRLAARRTIEQMRESLELRQALQDYPDL